MPLSFLGVLLIFPVNALVRALRNVCSCCWRCCCADTRRGRTRVAFDEGGGRSPYQTLPDAGNRGIGGAGSEFSPRGGGGGFTAVGLDDSLASGGGGGDGLNEGLTVLSGRDKVQLPTPPPLHVRMGPTLHPTRPGGSASSVASGRSARRGGDGDGGGGGSAEEGGDSAHGSSAESRGGTPVAREHEGLDVAPGRRRNVRAAGGASTRFTEDTEVDGLLSGARGRGLVVPPLGGGAGGAKAPLV